MLKDRIQLRDYNVIPVNNLTPYGTARLIEQEALLDHLVKTKVLDPDNLASGIIVALGSGHFDQIALRRQTIAPIYSVDKGRLREEDTKRLNKIAPAGFADGEDVFDFFPERPYLGNNCSLITAFYVQRNGFSEPATSYVPENRYQFEHNNLLEQVGQALKPKGQLLVTSDQKQPWIETDCPWGNKVSIVGNEYTILPPNYLPEDAVEISPGVFQWDSFPGPETWSKEWSKILRLPPPALLLEQLGPGAIKRCHLDLEEGSSENQIDSLRDRNVWVLTKK